MFHFLFLFFFFFDTRGIKKKRRRREKRTTPHRIIYLLSKTEGSRFAYAHSERKGNKTFFLLLRNLLSRVEREATPRGSIFHWLKPAWWKERQAIVSVRWRNKLRSKRIILSKIGFDPERMTTIDRKWITNSWLQTTVLILIIKQYCPVGLFNFDLIKK